MKTTYEVREKGDGEFNYFAHSPEQNGETLYEPENKASALAYANTVGGGYVVEITETKAIPCQLCGGSGLDKAHQYPDGSFAYCERCEGNGAPASLAALIHGLIVDVEAMQLEECPVYDLRETGDDEYKDHWYGGFQEGQYDDEDFTFDVQWPCLGILIEQIKEAIK